MTTIILAAAAIVLLAAIAPACGQASTPLPVPCSSAATRALTEACLLNLTYTHLGYEETGQWDLLMDTLSDDAYEFYAPTLLGGVKSAPHDSDQSLYHMYARIEWTANVPADMVNIPTSIAIGFDTVTVEYIAQFNHSLNFWMVPYPPSNRLVSVPVALLIGFDSDNKMTYERIYTDGASILAQIGILKDGYGVYTNDIEPPTHPKKACKGYLPVIGPELATLMLEGPTNTSVRFNGFYANEALPNGTHTVRSEVLGADRAAQPFPKEAGYPTLLSMIGDRLAAIEGR